MNDVLTYFAPPEREIPEKLESQCLSFRDFASLKEFGDAMPDVFLILNNKRQIVFANKSFLELFPEDEKPKIYGQRPGEALHCVHADEIEGGCGTSETCQTCGAVNSIMTSLNGKFSVQECRIETVTGDALDFRVFATPYYHDGEIYSIFSLNDISNEKRREVMERIFFHDIMNTAGGLRGFAELLKNFPEDVDEYKDIIYNLSQQIIEEVNTHKIITSAEKDELKLRIDEFNADDLITELVNSYKAFAKKFNVNIAINCENEIGNMITDRTLLRRVLANMTKNSIEASKNGETVTVSTRFIDSDNVEFEIHNSTFMPRNIQLQIFQRSFSTKGIGRGLGTYSIKLLSEKYLKGRVFFTSSEEKGTSFFAHFHLNNFNI